MPSKRRITHRRRTDTENNLSPVASRNAAATLQQQAHPAHLVRQTRHDPRSLASGNVLQLQGVLGNQAVGRLLARTTTPKTDKSRVQQKEEVGGPHPGMILMRAPTKKQPESKETRLPGSKNETFEWPDGAKTIHDPFDQSLTNIFPDGSGWQITYTYVEKPGTEPPEQEAQIAHTELLSPLRVKALGFLDAKQGTFQETEDEQKDRLAKDKTKGAEQLNAWLSDKKNNGANSAANQAAYADFKVKNEAYMASLQIYQAEQKAFIKARAEAKRNGQKPPPVPIPPVQPKRPTGMPVDPRTTLCNGFPTEMAKALTGDGAKLGGMKLSDIAKEGAWHTLETHPEGPNPGDVCSLATAGAKDQPDDNKRTLMHVGVFKSKRPGPNGLEIWTFVDGGQGTYEGRQQVQERTRFFNPQTQILSTKMADAGQNAGDRWLRGWLDIDTHLKEKSDKTP